VFLCHGWAARRMTRCVRLRCTPGATAFAGEPLPLSFEVENPTAGFATLRIVGPLGLKWFFPQLPPTESIRCSAGITVPQRGIHRLGWYTAVSAYPFGVLEHRRPLDEVPEVYILPAMGRIREKLFHHWLRHSGAGDHRRSRPKVGTLPSEGDVRGIRPYRHGDNPRDVHWKSTARRGQLYVREYDCATPQELVVVVEPYAPSAGEDYEPLEQALSLAATISWTWANAEGSGRVRVILLGTTELSFAVSPASATSLRPLAGLRGELEPRSHDPMRHVKSLRHAHRVFVSSRKGSACPARFAAAGLPMLVLESGSVPAWYQPPTTARSKLEPA
jgi:uncharacterized protein (DUF58 family)